MAVDQYQLRKFGYPLTSEPLRVSNDQGNISVIEDDGTLITKANRFDLANTSITFTPAAGAYAVVASSLPQENGTAAAKTFSLSDDDTAEVALPFPFTFFGTTYTSVFLNTDGNLTFGVGDSASTDRDLQRLIGGAPRIAPLLNDLNPLAPARITMESFNDRALFTWIDTGEWTDSGSRGKNTFQVVVFSNGTIRFSYRTIEAQGGVVGISPGGGNTTVDVIDLSAQFQPSNFAGTVAEAFATTPGISLAAVSKYFYRSHQDVYDFLMVFSDFSISLDSAFAYTISLRNDIRGIMPGKDSIFDRGSSFGSAKRLQAMSNMGSLSNYPLDPTVRFLGENTSLSVIAHEFGHRWLAFVDTADEVLLGRQQAHWSFFNNTSGSVMEGNEILDLGNGGFRTVGAVTQYSPLDQYIMGLRAAAEVPPWFVVTQPKIQSFPGAFTAGCRGSALAACNPYVGLSFTGTRREVSLDEIIGNTGVRIPAVQDAPKTFRVAFILLTQKGQTATSFSVSRLDAIRSGFENFFAKAVDGRGSLQTDLVSRPATSIAVDGTLAVNGSRTIVTAGTEAATRVGYARIDNAFGMAVLQSRDRSQVVSEAAIPAAVSGTSFLLYAERTTTASTGLAIVNPGLSKATLTIRLSSGLETQLSIPAGGQLARFIQELFSAQSIGSNFRGTAAVTSDLPIAVTALRGTTNEAGVFLIASVPLSVGAPPPSAITVFPQVAAGGGYSTELILINPSATRITGTLDFSSSFTTDRGQASRFTYDIAAGGQWQIRALNAGPQTQIGYAAVVPDANMNRSVGSAIFSLTADGVLRFQATVPAQTGVTRAAMLATQSSGIAIANRGAATTIRLTAYDESGTVAGTAAIAVAAGAHKAAFLSELMTIPATFRGTVALDATSPVHAITLRSRVTAANGFILTAMPVVDLDAPPTGATYFPQLVDGGDFTTEIILLKTGTAGFRVQFFGTDGMPLPLVLQ